MMVWQRVLRMVSVCVVLGLMAGSVMGAQQRRKKPAADPATPPASAQSPEQVDQQLRADWKMGELKMTREAVDDASFPPDIKGAAMAAVDWFISQQEGLIAQAKQSPADEAKARQTRPQLEAQFNQKMAAVYNNPQLMAELAKRLKALNNEMDTMAQSADKMFANLDAVGLTAQQKQKVKPIVQEANANLKKVVAKSASKSTKDQATRDEAVTRYKEARQKLRQQLTPEQREKLAKKLAEQ